MKTFKGDFDFVLNSIKNNKNISVSRYGDGELMIIEGVGINLLNKGVGEFEFDPSNEMYKTSQKLLADSFTYQNDTYFIGIACRCCVGDEKFIYMKNKSTQNEKNLTWANIFVNSNYNRFINEFLPELKNRDIIVVCHEKSDITNLPFNIKNENLFKVKTNAWLYNLDLIDELKKYITENNINNHVFLISAGPFANILVHQLHDFNKNNTYLDVGSTMDKYFNLPLTRKYLNGGNTLNKICIW
jgi:hypothetical protein